ncbi:myosin light chain kinase 3 isoform X1 [Bufo gargarizans]|uniref:myosin light chain kinase 3 isoform X1 n=1 Tax=Bufo gargarizans TaxID=30331 RepID=UPI001CF55907|nr:myosin light chain kinase 3 isoform X1 [Bufo gargarizans]
MSKQDSIATCLAKMYESKFDHSTEPGKSPVKSPRGVNSMDRKLSLLNEKMDKLLNFQESVMGKLEIVHHTMDVLEKGMDRLSISQGPYLRKVEGQGTTREGNEQVKEQGGFNELIYLLKVLHMDSVIQQEKLDGLQKVVSTIDKVVEFVGNTLRNSKIVDFILKGTVPWRKETHEKAKEKSEEKETKAKHVLPNRDSQAEMQWATTGAHQSNPLADNKIPLKTSHCSSPQNKVDCSGGQPLLDTVRCPETSPTPKPWAQKVAGEKPQEKNVHVDSSVPHSQCSQDKKLEEHKKIPEEPGGDQSALSRTPVSLISLPCIEIQLPRESSQIQVEEEQVLCPGIKTNAHTEQMSRQELASHGAAVTGKDKPLPSATKSPAKNKGGEDVRSDVKETLQGGKSGMKHQEGVPKDGDATQMRDQAQASSSPGDATKVPEASSLHVIDDCPPPPAPFNHRIVSIKQAILSSCYTVCQHEVLGGGRFGQVHKCVEISSGLRLAAKIIKVKAPKDRDEVKNEINVMNQLNHVNLIQLYDAFECKNDLTLIMEYLDGGELFDRITDESYHLTELDAIMFTKQICEGIYYVHQQYILHLDLKPENILCVSRTGNQIKIIDFGLARRYKPREKLKVNFGTPEFLAPEVVNYDFVSFPTDMWSVGVITYMLLSGLSPFLGESDAETMNYIVNCNWDFDAETFAEVSEEAKDFISRLLVKEKSCRLSAGQCLKHEWLADLPLKAKKYKVRLKSQVLLQRYMAQKKWKKHFYVVAAANRLRKFQLLTPKPS